MTNYTSHVNVRLLMRPGEIRGFIIAVYQICGRFEDVQDT